MIILRGSSELRTLNQRERFTHNAISHIPGPGATLVESSKLNKAELIERKKKSIPKFNLEIQVIGPMYAKQKTVE